MILVYTTESCAPCASLKRYLDHKGVEYKTLNADTQIHGNALIKLTGQRTVPTTVINNKVITGLNYRAISEALNG